MSTESSNVTTKEPASAGAAALAEAAKSVETAPAEQPAIDPLLEKQLTDCKSYAEYGAGSATKWVLEKTEAKVISVDTVARELASVTRGSEPPKKFTPVHVDLGRTRRGGRPLSYDKKNSFPDYTDAIWKKGIDPEVVFINGRFRVCCFFTALKNAAPGTKIVFNGYGNLGTYRVVEDILKPSETTDSAALFVVPEAGKIDAEKLDKHIGMFRMVMD